jgi:methionyl-tRNA synthetase
VHFVTGLDEHGQTVARTARNAGATPEAWVDAVAADYRRALQALDVSCDDFIRTTEPRHAQAVHEVLRRIRQLHPGDIYEAACAGFYCSGCEAFTLSSDLVDGRCANHPTMEIEWVEEQSHVFRLSAYAERLHAFYETHPDFLVPPVKFEEILTLVAGGLQELVITRSQLPWGIPFPDARGQTVHVWFDALVNYLSATGFPDERYEELWPADVQIIGPDITRYHAVVWPAMLMAAGLELPRQVWVHGWLRTNGARFSKTGAIHVTLQEAIERHGPDALRYFLLLAMPWEGDGEFSWERFDSVYATTLARNLGDLASRLIARIIRDCDGLVPAAHADGELDRSHRDVLERYRTAMQTLQLSDGARQLERLGSLANRYLDERSDGETLAALHRALVRIAALAQPFMPGKAEELYRALGGRGSVTTLRWEEVAHPATAGWQVVFGAPLFPEGTAP